MPPSFQAIVKSSGADAVTRTPTICHVNSRGCLDGDDDARDTVAEMKEPAAPPLRDDRGGLSDSTIRRID